MKKYLFLLCAILFISTFCLAEAEKFSTAANASEEEVLNKCLESFNKLKKLGTGLQLYASDNDGNYPATMDELKIYWGTEDDISVWAEENVKYLGKGLKPTAPTNTPIAYDKVMLMNTSSAGTGVLFSDYHVEFVQKGQLSKYNIPSQKILVTAKILRAEKELLDKFLKIDDSNVQTLILNDEQVKKLLDAMKISADSNVIQAPKLMVLDGEAATVNAIKAITYIKDYLPAKDDKSKPEPIMETIQAGIELNVTPKSIAQNNEETILLDVNMVSTKVDIKQFEKNGNIVGVPMMDSIHIVSKVVIQDGQTIVLGGMKAETITDDLSGLHTETIIDYKPKQIEMVVLLKAKKVE